MLIRDESHYRIKFEEFEKMNKKEREKFFAHMGSLDLMFKSFQQRMELGDDSSSM